MSHHSITFKDLPEGGEKFEPAKASALITPLLGVAVLGLAASAYYFFGAGEAVAKSFAYSWLFAFFVGFTLVVGGCFWILLFSASNSSWCVAVRRLFEQLANLAPVLFFLGLPLLCIPAVKNSLYEWMVIHKEAAHHAHANHSSIPAELHHMNEHVLHDKFGYLNDSEHFTPFTGAAFSWTTRFVIYFLILWHIARTLRGKSVKQDADGDIRHTIKARFFSCRWLLLFALTVTFAAVDWVMSLNATWFSTMWGVYIFAGSAWSSMAIMILALSYLRSIGYLNKVVTSEHYHLMGKLQFAFTVFWAYIAYSQYFLIWYANVTEETQWYLLRNTGGWQAVSIFLVLGHFVIPFVALIQQQLKKKPVYICSWAAWVFLMHLVDIYWNIIPERGPSITQGGQLIMPGAWIGDIVALVTVLGTLGYVFMRTLSGQSLYPWRDPRLLESVNVTN